MRICALALALLATSAAFAAKPAAKPEPPPWATKDLRAGIIGTDNSHAVAFSGIIRAHPEWRIKVVAAFKGGSPDMPMSADRVEKFAATLREKGVEIVDTIDELLSKVDVVLIHSVDGRPHLAQATPVFKAGKRLFIDKPLAATVADARRILELSQETGTPFFSASTMRFRGNALKLRENPGVGKVLKVRGNGAGPGMMNGAYGIHGLENMYTVIGPGCVSVTKARDENGDEIYTGKWKDGRLGIACPRSNEKMPRVRVWGSEGTADFVDGGGTYDGIVRAIAEFFHTGRPPVDPAETLEIIEFMVAAQLSKERQGAEVTLEEVRKPPASTYLETIRKRDVKASPEKVKK